MNAATPPFGRRKPLFDGRIEKRSPTVVPVYLATTQGPRFSERIFTRNVSPHGARLVTKRLLHPREEPLIAPLTGDFPQQARVLYCHPRPKGAYYLGLQLPGRSVRWPGSFRGNSVRCFCSS